MSKPIYGTPIGGGGASGASVDLNNYYTKNEVNSLLEGYATDAELNSTNTSLESTDKTLVELQMDYNSYISNHSTTDFEIDEIESIAKGATQGIAYPTYYYAIQTLQGVGAGVYNIGQNIYIGTINVPDLWISENAYPTSETYQYNTDEDVANDLRTNGHIRVGYYELCPLETLKVDLTNYATKDYVDSSIGNVGGRVATLEDSVNQDIIPKLATIQEGANNYIIFDCVITLKDLDAGKTINELLSTARGRVLVHLLGGDMPYYCNQRYGTGEDITVPEAVTYIEFACDLPFAGNITGAGTGCQVLRGANSYDDYYTIQGFKGGVEHCHGKGWALENCVNISHCYVTTMTDCSNISDCSRLKEISEVSYFTNCKFINNFMIDGNDFYNFNNCSYLRNIECSAGTVNYSNCLYVDAHTCAGFLATEDIGKVQALTADGSFATVPYAKGVSF